MYICPTNYLSTYMKHTILSLILLAWGAQAYPQTTENVPSDATFTPPFDFPITFSGNFGEIRANHFHGGLDFKQEEPSANRYMPWPKDIFRVFASRMVRDMCSM